MIDTNIYFSNETLLPIVQSKYKNNIRGLKFWNDYIKSHGYTINPNAIHSGLRKIDIKPITDSVLVNGKVSFDKNRYDITINQSLFHFYSHACLLFVSNMNFVKGTGVTFPNLPKNGLDNFIQSKIQSNEVLNSGIDSAAINNAAIQLVKEFWSRQPFSKFFIDYHNKLEPMHAHFASALLNSMISFVVAHELAHVIIESPNRNIQTNSFDFYTNLAKTMAEIIVPSYIKRARNQSQEYLHKILGGLTETEVTKNWKVEFSADVVGTTISCLSIKKQESNEAKQYALDCFAYLGSELVFILTQLLEDYYIHETGDIPYFNTHPFGKDRFDFIRMLANKKLFPNGLCLVGDVFREKIIEIIKFIDNKKCT